MVHQLERISQSKTDLTAANAIGGVNAIQLKDNRNQSVIQGKRMNLINSQNTSFGSAKNVLQLKTRISEPGIFDVAHQAIMPDVQALKTARKTAKNIARTAWINRAPMPGQNLIAHNALDQGGKDAAYNNEMVRIRAAHEVAMQALAARAVAEGSIRADQVKNGADYYGDVERPAAAAAGVVPAVREIRSREGKSFVSDDRGTFVPRLVRRELSAGIPGDLHQIDTPHDSTTRGLRNNVQGRNPVAAPAGVPMTDNQREFHQQNSGGGGNTYAISHTATTGPILSNAHDNFGETSAGNLISDVANTSGLLRAQWQIAPQGHKVPYVPPVRIGSVGRTAIVARSGYRNMEVLTGTVRQADMAAIHRGAETPGRPAPESIGGEELEEARRANLHGALAGARVDTNTPRV